MRNPARSGTARCSARCNTPRWPEERAPPAPGTRYFVARIAQIRAKHHSVQKTQNFERLTIMRLGTIDKSDRLRNLHFSAIFDPFWRGCVMRQRGPKLPISRHKPSHRVFPDSRQMPAMAHTHPQPPHTVSFRPKQKGNRNEVSHSGRNYLLKKLKKHVCA